MDLGVWMSSAAWRHKCNSPLGRETWCLPELPDNFIGGGNPARLYVAIRGYWRGYFIVDQLLWNPADRHAAFSLAFAPSSWNAIDPLPAPPRHITRFTLNIPSLQHGERNKPL